MNHTNLRRLIDHLKTLPDERFNMAIYSNAPRQQVAIIHNHCETVGCIAGHAVQAFGNEMNPGDDAHDAAQKWLGLRDSEANYLFLGNWAGNENMREITLEETIEHLSALSLEYQS